MNNKTILITAGLSDYKLQTKIEGLVRNDLIESIIIVRKNKLKNTDKINNISPPILIQKLSLLFEIWRLLTLIKICRSHKIHAIIGIQLVAHGISAVIAGKVTKTHCVACPIGKDIHSYLNGSVYSPLLKFCTRNADMIAIMGPKSKELMLEQNINANKLIRLNNYIDPKLFEIKEDDHIYKWDFIYIGQLIKRKNIDQLITAISIVKKTHKNVKLAIVGAGPEKNKLVKLSENLRLSNNIEFLGYINSNNIKNYLYESRVFVLVSEIEALPAAAIEAMHCGVPSLLTNICDIPGIFKDKHNSLLVPPNNLNALVSSIMTLMKNQALYVSLKNGCDESREKYQQTWSIKKQTHAWDKLLKL